MDCLSLNMSARCLRSDKEGLLCVPVPADVQLVVTWERAFSVAALCLWNALPQETCLALDLL